jgi:phage/plasmid-associated DNA primase
MASSGLIRLTPETRSLLKGNWKLTRVLRDDEKFILEQVAPAMLNKLLERLPLLLSEGIDYKATKDAMQKAQEESRHLWQFVRDAGIEYKLAAHLHQRFVGAAAKVVFGDGDARNRGRE